MDIQPKSDKQKLITYFNPNDVPIRPILRRQRRITNQQELVFELRYLHFIYIIQPRILFNED